MDREKVIKAYEDFVNGYECFCTSDDYEYEMHKAVLALLKEQDGTINELQNAYGYLQKQFFEVQDKLLNQDSVEHACDILRANGWKETEPLCSECDAVHVVLCKDCKHGDPCNGGEIYCEKDIGTIITAVHKPDWFCADGERKTDDA